MKKYSEKRNNYYGAVFCFVFFVQTVAINLAAQKDSVKTAGPWRVEVEPTAFIGKGYSVLASRAVGPQKDLSIGFYYFSVELPSKLNSRIFENVGDSATVRLTFETALTVRYHFRLKGKASGPYAGLFFGYETFKITTPGRADLGLSNMFCTPQLGYEFYYYKKLLYINPSVRSVFEFDRKTDNASRNETIKDHVFLPSLALGIRF
jgi:hypothetical protein